MNRFYHISLIAIIASSELSAQSPSSWLERLSPPAKEELSPRHGRRNKKDDAIRATPLSQSKPELSRQQLRRSKDSAHADKNIARGLEKTSVPDQTESPAVKESKQPSLSTETPKQPSLATETPKQPSLATETPKQPSLATETPKQPSLATETPKQPSLATETPKQPLAQQQSSEGSETEKARRDESSTKQQHRFAQGDLFEQVLAQRSITNDHPFIQLLHTVLSQSPKLKGAQLQVAIERMRSKSQRSKLLPRLDLSASSESLNKRFDGINRFSSPSRVSLQLEQDLLHREKKLSLQSTKIDAKLAQLSSQILVQDVIEETCRRYLDLHRFQSLLEFSRNNAGLANEHLRSTRIRQEKGELTITDVQQALVRSKTANAVNRESKSQVDIAAHRLKELLQQDPPETLPFFNVQLSEAELERFMNFGLDSHRPDIEILKHRLQKEKLQKRILNSQNLPQIFLRAEQGRSWDRNITTTSLTGNPIDDTSISLNFSLNLFKGGQTHYDKLESKLRQDQYLLNIEHQQLEAQRFIRETALKVQLSAELVATYREAVQAATDALLGIQEEFLVGTRTALDAFDAQNELFISQTRWLNAKVDHILSSIALFKHLGTLNFEHLQQVVQAEESDES